MGEDLTMANFVQKIKLMGERERSKLSPKKLCELISQLPDPTTEIAELRASIEHITKIASVNQTEILSLKTSNEECTKKNIALQMEINLLKEHARECVEHRDAPQQTQPRPPPPQQQQNAELDAIRTEIAALQVEMNNIQQYLRINNLEIVGLPDPNDGESDETLLINALNDLDGLDEIVTPEDIDISHPMKSQRKDGKSVHVVKFISRKTKGMILSAKKQENNKQFKFRNCEVYINEHLSKVNRSIFAAAQEKKKNLNYKYCWTRGGTIHMRKTDDSPVITISTADDLNNLN